jgi:hypothetical protein
MADQEEVSDLDRKPGLIGQREAQEHQQTLEQKAKEQEAPPLGA